MAIQFNETTNHSGLVQRYEDECGFPRGYVSGNTDELKKFNARANLALDKYRSIAIPAGGTWQLGDSNHSDYEVIYATLTSGRKDYKFLTDETGNVILDIYKVLILPSATATTYVELEPVDETLSENVSMIDENGTTGTPTTYSKRSNAIFLGATPNYTVARGIKVMINRESSYFTYTDTTKKAGYPYHQEYFFLKPAYEELRINGTADRFNRVANEILKLEGDQQTGRIGLIEEAYSRREKDVRKIMSVKKILYI